MRLVGPAFAGIMVGKVGVQAVLLIDAATFLVSAVTIAFIDRAKLSRRPPSVEKQEEHSRAGFVASMVAGLKTIWVTPVLLGIGGFAFLRDMVQGGTNIMLLPMVERYFSTEVYGWTLSAFAFGGLIGGVVAGRVPGTWMARALGLSCLLGGLAQVGFGSSSNVGFLLVFGGMTTIAITVQGISRRLRRRHQPLHLVPKGSPLWPGLLVDMDDPKDRKLEPSRKKKTST